MMWLDQSLDYSGWWLQDSLASQLYHQNRLMTLDDWVTHDGLRGPVKLWLDVEYLDWVRKAAVSLSQSEKSTVAKSCSITNYIFRCLFQKERKKERKTDRQKERQMLLNGWNKNHAYTMSCPDQQVSWIKSEPYCFLTACALSVLHGEVQAYLFHFCFLTETPDRRPSTFMKWTKFMKKALLWNPLQNQYQIKKCLSFNVIYRSETTIYLKFPLFNIIKEKSDDFLDHQSIIWLFSKKQLNQRLFWNSLKRLSKQNFYCKLLNFKTKQLIMSAVIHFIVRTANTKYNTRVVISSVWHSSVRKHSLRKIWFKKINE